MTIWAGSLCSGYGGLDLAVSSVLGSELAWVADSDPGASAILAHRFPGVPNFGDVRLADWASAAPVDVLTAGFPCQPVSAAGKRKGTADERWLFDDICAAIGRMGARPRLLLLENVPGLLSANGGDAMARVVQGLAALGYVGRYRLVRASDAGACHKRERVFILAWPADADGTGEGRPELPARGHEPGRRPAGGDLAPANADGAGREGRQCPGRPHEGGPTAHGAGRGPSGGDRPAEDADSAAGGERRQPAPGQAESGGPRADAGGPGGAPAPADACRNEPGRDDPFAGDGQGDTGIGPRAGNRGAPADPGRGGRVRRAPDAGRGPGRGTAAAGHRESALDWGPYEAAVRRWERALGRPAPRPTEQGRTGQRLAPAFVEWMQGLPEGWVTDVPGLSRNAMLKALGNGVVPQQAELALQLDCSGFCGRERAA